MLELLFLILGLVGLIIGTELIIRGSLNIAEHFKISQLFIGLTILAIGTDLPELFVVITGAISKLRGVETSGLIVGNALGSCFGQIGLTLGLLGLLSTLVLTKRGLKRDCWIMLGTVVLLFLTALDGTITRVEGVMFIVIYVFYLFTLFREERLHEKIARAPKMYLWWAFISLIAGLTILVYCSNIVINNALQLAILWHAPQSLIGILIIGLGTSLPELSVSLGALRRKAYGLSVGNLVGSNIFDILIPLGIGSTIAGLNVSKSLLQFDIPILFIISAVVLLFFRTKMRLDKKEAITLIAIYAIYAALKIMGLF